jgi:hypothetical protein
MVRSRGGLLQDVATGERNRPFGTRGNAQTTCAARVRVRGIRDLHAMHAQLEFLQCAEPLGSRTRRRMNDASFERSRNTAAVISLFRSVMSRAWGGSICVMAFHNRDYCRQPKNSCSPVQKGV